MNNLTPVSPNPTYLSRNPPLSAQAWSRSTPAKRGLPPIPAFGIGWLYPLCPPDEVLPYNAADTKFRRSLPGTGILFQGLP